MTKAEQIEYLFGLNASHAAEFASPDARNARSLYRATHPTEVAVLKCMDGRIHGSIATQTPLGILQPFRNLGGRFEIGWPHFQLVLAQWIDYAISKGRQALVLVTYHFSAGNPHRGCAGWNYDTAAAVAFTAGLKREIEEAFGVRHEVVYPVQVGFETDEDAFVLHGRDGETVELAGLTHPTEGDLIALLQRLYPDMPQRILLDFLPLVRGNIEHISKVRASRRPILDLEHREWILALGRGYDWLHTPNTALIVGPWSHNLEVPVATAAGIIASNMEAGRIPGVSAILLTSGIFRDPAGTEPRLAAQKARFLARMAMDVVGRHFPDLARTITPLPVIVDMNTRRMQAVGETLR